jgi:hypothetical protein
MFGFTENLLLIGIRAGILQQSMEGQEPSRNRIVVVAARDGIFKHLWSQEIDS